MVRLGLPRNGGTGNVRSVYYKAVTKDVTERKTSEWDHVLGKRWDLIGGRRSILVAKMTFTERPPLRIITASVVLMYDESFGYMEDGYRTAAADIVLRHSMSA